MNLKGDQYKIARVAEPRDKIDANDFKVLKKMRKKVNKKKNS
tara:strand:+ start:1376 stop:1501 length:126 start_codon:yes stop_codon:yes gene_type:complete